MGGAFDNKRVFKPRMNLIDEGSQSHLPFKLKRRQFAVKLAFAMTINKSQGQTLSRVGLILPSPLSPKKSHFYLREAEWCGKEISADGITHSPSRIQGLVDLSPPTTAADLQQFVCATNWMRASIPGYNQLVDPLRRLLDVATKAAGSCKKTALVRVALPAVGWSSDHLKCFNNPSGSNVNMAKYQADKLQRWSLEMPTFPRWGLAPADQPVVNVRELIHVVSPLQQVDFEWPTAATISGIQRSTMEGGGTPPNGVDWDDNGVDWDDDSHFYVDPDGRIWIPDGASVKDNMSGFVQQFAAESADSAATAQCLMTWFTTFGCVHTWVPDGGSHFKNEVTEKVRKWVGAHYHITTAYSPWANMTEEVVNRLVLRAVKALLSEMKLNADEWPHVLPLVQGALNHQPTSREMTEDLEAQIKFGDGGFHVERLDEARCVDGQHQVLMKWLGLDDEVSSWEPAANLLDDIPVVFRKWAAANKKDPAVAALIKTLDFP
ncbi:hypothetical protein H257_19069 [Aphanomyces astaci]|uniref:Chromo domain-containing protein n=1 Tax=Aphanomyces astaci TaxID=112090 RepID=W4FAP1_APHAT|nr:hypothetical protein H257_19069 [Aphanomyces astaci]ETV63994.1 hypothetical protein H257_19069 [Aphanomyces astaci]|eukprot:XP_009846520.1 hypothetical protein H257_19069 [Aphanomyces astaci]